MMNYLFELVDRRKDLVRLNFQPGKLSVATNIQNFIIPRTKFDSKKNLSSDFIK